MRSRISTLALVSVLTLGSGAPLRAQEAAAPEAASTAASVETTGAAAVPAEAPVPAVPERVATREDELAPMTRGGSVPPEAIQDPEVGLDLFDEREIPSPAARRAKHEELLARWRAAGPDERQAIMAERLETWKNLTSEQRVSIRNRWKVRWHQWSLAERDAFKAKMPPDVPEETVKKPRERAERAEVRTTRSEARVEEHRRESRESRRAAARRERVERRRAGRLHKPSLIDDEEEDDDDDEDEE